MSSVINSYMANPGIQASGGDSVSYVVESGIPYAYHTFTRSGSHSLNVLSGSGYIKVLVVAGGGGGGMDMGGGGGGGGVIYSSYYVSQSSTPISVFVGNGGKGAPAAGVGGQNTAHQYNISATNGENSIFGTLTAIGGGYGGSSYFDYGPNNGYGNTGGCGGGASGYSNGGTGRNGSGIIGQGYNGGGAGGQYYSGGGGGAGGVGNSGTAQANGGPGIRYSDMSSFYFGGGGGGAAYSLGTGGNGGIGGGGGGAVGSTTGGAGINNGSPGGGGGPNQWANTPGGNAGANTGGGGGGGAHYNSNNKGGEGGSGIVIVKYPLSSQLVYNNINIVKNGLGLHLDATDPNSNIGINNIWADISNNGLNVQGPSNLVTGTSGYLNYNQAFSAPITSLLNTDTHTICLSVQINNSSGTWDKIFGFPGGGSDRSPGVWRYPSSRRIHWRYDPGNFGIDLSVNGVYNDTADNNGVEFSPNTWYYICITKNGTIARAYINGNFIGQKTNAPATKTAGAANVQLYPGYTQDSSRMRHVHIYNRVLTDQEIYQNYLAIASSLV
jgi:hypothetical protein